MRNPGTNLKMTVNKLVVSYNDEGPDDAPVIIFIHGFPFDKSTWNSQLEALENNYRVIAYDVRGHGSSDAGQEDFTIELFVSDLISFMDALKIDKTMLCGLSMGGYIALNAIENHPKRFNALIMCDTNCIADSPDTKLKRMNAIESVIKHGVEKYADESIVNLFAPESFATMKEEIAGVRAIIINTTKESICNTILALSGRKETCSKLGAIKVKVLIMVGREDIITPPAAARLMHEKVKNSVLHIIGHAGHLSNMENPFEFNDHLKTFVASVNSEERR